VFEAVAVVAGFDDMAVMGEPIQQCRGHLGVIEHGRPFREAQVGGDDEAGLLVELVDEMEQKRAAGLAERQVSQFIEDHQVGVHQAVGDTSGFSRLLFLLQLVDQFVGVTKLLCVFRHSVGPGA